MLTLVLAIEGLIIAYIVFMILRKRRSMKDAPERIDISLPEEKRLEQDTPEDDSPGA